MPSGFVDDPEGDVADKEVDDGSFGDDILAADADGVDVLLLNVGQHHTAAVTNDLCRGIDVKGVGCIPESLLHMRSERLLAVVRKGDIALGDGDGVHWLAVQQHRPLPGLGVEDPHGDLLSPCLSLLLQVNFYVLQTDDISVGCGRTDPTRNDSVVQHPCRLAFADMKHLVELLQGYFSLLRHHISSPHSLRQQGACRASSPPRPWRWRRGENKYLPSYSCCCGQGISESPSCSHPATPEAMRRCGAGRGSGYPASRIVLTASGSGK